VTAAVAIITAFSGFKRSRADRDYRRLEVIDKALALEARGQSIPPDIAIGYLGRSTPNQEPTVHAQPVNGRAS
jgi:hypothetical protein